MDQKKGKQEMKIWIEHFPAKRASRGLAEIYVDGGAMKYLTRTCIGRIYQKHLPEHTADRIIQEIEKTITRTDFLSSFNLENTENGKKNPARKQSFPNPTLFISPDQ